MQPKRKKSQFWYLAAPLLINWGISIATAIGASIVYSVMNYSRMLSVADDQEALIQMAGTLTNELLQYSTEITMVASLCSLPLMWYFFHKDRVQEKLLGNEVRAQGTILQYGAVIVMGIGVCITMNNLILLSSVISYSDTYTQTATNLYKSPFIIQLIGLGIIIPIVEELIYRGLLFKRLREHLSARTSIIGSALIFGAFHGNLVQFLYATVIGLLLAYVYEKFGSVKAPMLFHVVANLTSIIATKAALFDWMFKDILRIEIGTVLSAILAAAMYLVVRDMGDNGPKKTEKEANCS